jgi:hypothetical protein
MLFTCPRKRFAGKRWQRRAADLPSLVKFANLAFGVFQSSY